MKNRLSPQRRRPVTPEDLLRIPVVSEPQIAPDGRRIVFVVKQAGEKNGYVSNLWIVEREEANPHTTPSRNGFHPHRDESIVAGKVTQFTAGGKDFQPHWSPDGKRIAFIRDTTGATPQIHLIDAFGGEARQLSHFPEGSLATFRWSPDGKWLAVSFRNQEPHRTEAARRDRRERGLSDPPLVIEGLFYRLDGEGYFGDQRYHLYLVDAEGDAQALLYDEDTRGDISFDFSPDSRQLVLATNRDPQPTLHPESDELLRIDVATGRTARIPGLPPGPKTSVRWSPDGRVIAYAGRAGTDPLYSTENVELFICNAVQGGAKSLTAGYDICLWGEGVSDTASACCNPALEFSADGSRIYVRVSIRGESHVASLEVAGGGLVFHTSGARDVQMGNLSADGRLMALCVGNPLMPAEIAVADCRLPAPRRNGHAANGLNGAAHKSGETLFSLARLTDLSGPLLAELRLSAPEPYWIKADDGHPVQVWVIKPLTDSPPTNTGRRMVGPHKARGKKVPAVLQIHGGPHAQYGSSFFHEFQVLAAAGYAVFYSNPRGSKGYGRNHCAAIRGRWGTADWTDLQAVAKFMKQQPYVDQRRMGVMGGSYGGYMTNWVVSHTHDFAAAVTERCLSNLLSGTANTDVIEPVSQYYAGNFWNQPEARWDQSPIKFLGNVRTPMLIIHSEGDLRCNIEQADQLYTALRLLGVPARFVRYPACTSHGMSRTGPPDLRIHRMHQILEWWRKYLGRPAKKYEDGNRYRVRAGSGGAGSE